MITRERVEAVLGRVRPFPQADGGDIELIDISGNSADVKEDLYYRLNVLPVGYMSASILLRAGAQPPNAAMAMTAPTGEAAAPVALDDRLLELESNLILWALKVSNGNKSKAAELLQIKRSTLGDRINWCGLRREAAPATECGGAHANAV